MAYYGSTTAQPSSHPAGISGAIVGVTDGSNAAAGKVGEFVSSFVSLAGNIALTNNVSTVVTSITLTPGDWDVTFMANIRGAAGTTGFILSILPNAAGTGGTYGIDQFEFNYATPNNSWNAGSIPNFRTSISANTTYYAAIISETSSGSTFGLGRFSARRIR